jgi:glucosamine--fructose-6-phosphate aminotransferase (isomerizing)
LGGQHFTAVAEVFMCGIVGYIGAQEAVPVILDGLRRLEYRGYDSAGVAVLSDKNCLDVRRASGKLCNLEEAVRNRPLAGSYGIGHTRWATHGRPTEENAHPHRDCKGEVVVVHNGIVENYLALRKELTALGHKFVTETDTEVIAHLVEQNLNGNLEDAVRTAVKRVHGVFAISVISSRDPNKIVAARQGPPVVIGLGNQEFFVASDVPAILSHTRDMFFLSDGDLAIICPDGVRLTDFDGKTVARQVSRILWDPIMAEKGGFKHFMLKEIFEQPRAIKDTMLGRIGLESGRVFLDEVGISDAEFKTFEQVKIVACGTSWHAGLTGKFIIERLARLPCRSGLRKRVPLPRSHHSAQHPDDRRFAIGRNG